MIIVIVGESATGKSTIEKILENKYGFKKTVSYTTRQKREKEVDGIDYFFVSENEFINKQNDNFFVEVGEYNGWYYGTAKNQFDEKNIVCVLTPHGLRQLNKIFNKDKIKSFYIKIPRRDRLIQQLKRGDNIDEAIRRNQSDIGMFDGIEDEVDYVVYNKGYARTPEQIASEIISLGW